MGQAARRKRFDEVRAAPGYVSPPVPTREDRVTALETLRALPLGSGVGLRAAALDALRHVEGERRALADDMTGVVGLGRAVGCTWAEIGAAVGITRQAARERWHDLEGSVPS